MGFFSDLLGTAATLGGAFLGVQAPMVVAPAAVAPTLLAGPTTALAAVRTTAAILGTEDEFAAGTRGGAGSPGPIDQKTAQALFRAAGSPSGGLRKRTIVETFDPGSGFITRRRFHAGGVAVFAADVAAARRINRQVRRLDARLPRKTVKESKIKQLTDRVIKNALEHAGDPHDNGVCPK